MRAEGTVKGLGFALLLIQLAACGPTNPPADNPSQQKGAAVEPPNSKSSFSGSDTNLSPSQLETLVGPVALYSDDLLALVLPASTQPLEIVEAQRLLDQRKSKPDLKPPTTWDPSVVALLNYPETVQLMNADLNWTEQLGTSVVHQQQGVMDAIQSFRKQARDAGNLKSDDKQKIAVDPAGGASSSSTIVIAPADPQVIYVPTYQPATVIYPGYAGPYYWSAPYPYYYYPTAPFYTGAAYGVTVGFALSWSNHDIYRGDVEVTNVNRIERNGENVWRPDPAAVSRAQSARSEAANSLAGSSTPGSARAAAQSRVQAGSASVSAAQTPGAFSGVDRAAATSALSARGTRSLSGAGFRAGARGR